MTLTIPSKLTNGKELVIIAREEYEALLGIRNFIEFQPTSKQKKILQEARKNRTKERVITLNELKNDLGLTD